VQTVGRHPPLARALGKSPGPATLKRASKPALTGANEANVSKEPIMSAIDCRARPLAIAGELTIATASTWMSRLTDVLADDAVAIDASGVTAIDGAGLQLLLLARIECTKRGLPFRLHEPSRAVRAALAIAHLDAELQPCHAAPGEGGVQ